MSTFTSVHVINLHGSTKRLDKASDGTPDRNVFDIQQGVSIFVMVKRGSHSKRPPQYRSILGSRAHKYARLAEDHLLTESVPIGPVEPYFFLTDKDFTGQDAYEKGVGLDTLFRLNACGMVTARDHVLVNFDQASAAKLVENFAALSEADFRNLYTLQKDSRDWTYHSAKLDAGKSKIEAVLYRPFDVRYLPYSRSSKGVLSYPRDEIMSEMRFEDSDGKRRGNFGLLTCKQQSTFEFQHVLITTQLSDKCTVSAQTREAGYHFPLYLYPDETAAQADALAPTERTLNLDPKLYAAICEAAGIDPADTDMARENPLSLKEEGGAANAAEGVGVLRSKAMPRPRTPTHLSPTSARVQVRRTVATRRMPTADHPPVVTKGRGRYGVLFYCAERW
ncbi:MAG: type ISP restriction/modification enzyme [Altererythrobacter sp.]